jgi:hypothetical protein
MAMETRPYSGYPGVEKALKMINLDGGAIKC